MLTEDLTDLPLQQEVRNVLRRLIAEGHDPLDVSEAALATASALSISVEGQTRTGAKLYAAGAALLNCAGKTAPRH